MPEPFDTLRTPPELIQRQREALRTLRKAERARQETTVRIAPIVPRGLQQRVSATLPQAVERIVRELQPEAVILFGSYAYGAPTPDSDVDLLVIWETELPRLERYLAVSQLLSPRPFPEAQEAILSGAIIEENPEDKYSPSCLIYGHTQLGRPLHVLCSLPPRVRVITAYQPDPEHWIDNRVRRKS